MTTDTIELIEGQNAPDFELPTNNGGSIALSALSGSPVIVYFYPKDNTPGCTTEALDFTALKSDFDALGATIIGISPDTVRKHDNFVAKHDLQITLAADEEKKVIEAFGVWVEKKNYGKTYMGVERSTFLIAPDGTLAQIWHKVRVKGHARAVLDATKSLVTS